MRDSAFRRADEHPATPIMGAIETDERLHSSDQVRPRRGAFDTSVIEQAARSDRKKAAQVGPVRRARLPASCYRATLALALAVGLAGCSCADLLSEHAFHHSAAAKATPVSTGSLPRARIAVRAEPSKAPPRASAVQPAPKAVAPPAPAVKVVIHLTGGSPAGLKAALEDMRDIIAHYKKGAAGVAIEAVMEGNVASQIGADAGPGVAVSVCAPSEAPDSAKSAQPLPLRDGVRLIPSCIARIVELRNAGYVYYRP